MTEEFNIPFGAVGNYSDFCPCKHMSRSLRKICYTIFMLPERSQRQSWNSKPQGLCESIKETYYMCAPQRLHSTLFKADKMQLLDTSDTLKIGADI